MPTTFNNLLNDDGSNTTGTFMDKAELQALLMGTVVTSTSTGAVNNWAPGIDGHTVVKWNGAADAAFTGLAGGTTGQRVTVKNITSTKVATFAHQSGSSSAGNKFRNAATVGLTPIAAGGWLTYLYDGTDWQLVAHDQGAWITPAYAAGDFTGQGAMTWTVDSGDVITYSYVLRGRTLTIAFALFTTSVGGTPNAGLQLAIPAGLQAAGRTIAPCRYSDNGGAYTTGEADTLVATNTFVRLYTTSFSGANWSASTNLTAVYGQITLEVK